jgi:TolB protein
VKLSLLLLVILSISISFASYTISITAPSTSIYKEFTSRMPFYLKTNDSTQINLETSNATPDFVLSINGTSTLSFNLSLQKKYTINGEYKFSQRRYLYDQVLETIALYILKYDRTIPYLRLTYYNDIDEYPTYNPKNNKFFFISDRMGGNRDIYFYDLKDFSFHRFKFYPGAEYFTKNSDDGKYITFVTSMYGKWEIMKATICSTTLKDLKDISYNNLNDYSPTFTASDDIVYIREDPNKNANQIYIYKGGRSKRVTNDNYYKFQPTQYKNFVAFYTNIKKDDFGIYTYKNGKYIKIQDFKGDELDPNVYEDRFLSYVWNTNGSYDIWIKDLKYGFLYRVTNFNGESYYPDLNENFLLFESYRYGESDIWAQRLNLKYLDILSRKIYSIYSTFNSIMRGELW